MDAFEAWLDYAFNREPAELTDPAWYFRDEGDPPREWITHYARRDDDTATAERIRRLFTNAGELLQPYSDDQVAHGLEFIVNGSCGGEIWTLCAPSVPLALRLSGLRSIVPLFRQVFAARLPDHEEARTRLGTTCFMFWDVANLGPADNDTVLDVLEDTLAMGSVPCQRAALHGLGHQFWSAREHVPAIIDRWLERRPHAPEELRTYAAEARTGMIL